MNFVFDPFFDVYGNQQLKGYMIFAPIFLSEAVLYKKQYMPY